MKERNDEKIEFTNIPKNLQKLKHMLGKTWKGVSPDSDEEEKMVDISRWEVILQGQAVRVTHCVNRGEYGGETTIMWDEQKQQIVTYYFTTAGFYSEGSLRFEEGKIFSHEYIHGNLKGITQVKSLTNILSDGRLHVRSEYLKDGNWIGGHEFYYKEAPEEEVML